MSPPRRRGVGLLGVGLMSFRSDGVRFAGAGGFASDSEGVEKETIGGDFC